MRTFAGLESLRCSEGLAESITARVTSRPDLDGLTVWSLWDVLLWLSWQCISKQAKEQ